MKPSIEIGINRIKTQEDHKALCSAAVLASVAFSELRPIRFTHNAWNLPFGAMVEFACDVLA